MAANTSKNEVAAKMIGAQLQSLLKIPPIKKNAGQEPPQSEGKKVVGPATGAKEKTREFPVKGRIDVYIGAWLIHLKIILILVEKNVTLFQKRKVTLKKKRTAGIWEMLITPERDPLIHQLLGIGMG